MNFWNSLNYNVIKLQTSYNCILISQNKNSLVSNKETFYRNQLDQKGCYDI